MTEVKGVPLKVSYMGTKRNIASRVAAVIEEKPPRLSYRDLVEILGERGLPISHTTILRWVVRYAETHLRWEFGVHAAAREA